MTGDEQAEAGRLQKNIFCYGSVAKVMQPVATIERPKAKPKLNEA